MTPDEYLNQADEYIAAKSTKNPNAGSAEPKVFTERELGFQPRRTWGEAIKDTGAALAGGVAGLGKTAGDLYGLASGDMDNALSRYSQKGQEYFDEAKSGALKEKIAERSANIDAQDSTLGKAWTAVKDTLTDPALAMDTAASNAATMIPSMGAGRLAGGITAARGFAAAQAAAGAGKAITKEAADQVAMRAGRVATGTAIGTGAVQQGADVSGDIYGDLLKNTDAQWAQSPEYVAALQRNGGDAQAAKRELALGVARASFLPATAISVASNAIPGATLLERALVGAPAGAAAKAGAKEAGKLAGIRAFAKGVLGEGAQEFVEEGGGRLAANIAAQRVDPSHDTLDQVGENAGLGFAGGALLGIGGGVREGLAARRGFQPGADQQPGIDGAPPASVPPADGGQPLALPAPVIDVGGDGVARTADDRNARTQRINSGDITDVTPIRETPFGAAEAPVIEPAPVVQPPTPSEQLGLRSGPDAGTMENAAALAVDSGASPIAQTVDADGVLQDATQARDSRDLSAWTDEELSSTFRSDQAKEIRQQLAQEIARRRAVREQQALQDELDADQQALNEPQLPEGADAAFARTFEGEGDTVFQPRQEQGDGTQAQETQQAGAGQPQAGAAQTNAGAGENASAAGRGGVQEGGVGKYSGPADVSIVAGQKELANRAATISALKGMNGQIRAISPDEAWNDRAIEDANNLDDLRDAISNTLVRLTRGAQTTQENAQAESLRKRLDAASGSDLRQVFDRLGLAGARMTADERVRALMAEDYASVSQALDAVDGSAQQPALSSVSNADGDNTSPTAPASAPTPKQQKALDRIASGKAFFFSQPKAQAFIDDNGLSGTHELEQRGKSWHVVESQKSAATKTFAPETGTLGVPRSEMPQVPSRSHGALVNHLNAQGIAHETTTVDAGSLKPTQAEYSPAKVEEAKAADGDRAVIVSSDGHIIDGHHQAMAAAEEGKPVKAIVLDAPVDQALEAVKNSPSAQPSEAANTETMDLRKLAHAVEQPGDIMLGNDKFVTLEQAVAAAKAEMTPASWGMPFQFNRVLDIAPRDWNRMVQAMTGNEYRDPTKGGTTDSERTKAEAKPTKKPRGILAKKAEAEEAARAEYFTPGNIVKSYGGFDRVIEYNPSAERGGWEVQVQAVRKEGGAWVDVPNERARWHSTQPDAKELKAGPVGKVAVEQAPATAQPATAESVQEAAAKLPTDFITAPDGSLDYGEITPEMGKAMRRQAGKIRLRQGNEAWGLIHIQNRHGTQFAKLGFESAIDFIAHVAGAFNTVYKGKGAGLSLVLETDRVGGRLMVELEPSEDVDFYDVKTASPVRVDQYKNEKPLWRRVGTNALSAEADPLLPRGQSGSDSIAQSTTQVQPVTPAQVQAATEQIKNLIGAAIDAMPAGEVNRIAKKFLPTMGVKPTVSKAKNKEAFVDPKVNLLGAAAELGVEVPAEVRRALVAEAEGRVQEAPEPVSQPEARKAAKAGAKESTAISDFGEKIGGAKKDIWASMQDSLKAVADGDIASQPLSKIWPQPDYQALIDGGADPWVMAFARAARDEVPAKPRSGWKVKRWAEQVRTLRGLTVELMDGTLSVDEVRKKMLGLNSQGMRDLNGRVDLYMLVGHRQSLDGVRISSGQYSLYKGQDFNPPKTFWTVEKSTKATVFGNWPRELAIGNTREEALQAFKKAYDSLDINPAPSKEVSFEIYSRRGDDGKASGYWVAKKIGRNPIFLAGPFATVKEARAYRDEHQAELVEKLAKVKEIPRERRDTNEPRVGEDMRNGQDVTPQMFGDTFGFRGVEFGNWVEQGRRQKDLNDAFDALMDMAAVLGLPPKALSLNGELGLAFGARGSGGVNPASAHYERDKVVINLTKKSGAGSLGHEWWHALDNYFSRMRAQPVSMMTTALDVSLASRGSPFEHRGAVRKEMIQAYGAVVKAIRLTALKARSAKLDAKRTKEYWTTGHEMSARAFESYLISKLQDQNASNDYLANVVSPQTWKAAEALGFELEESYPYPTAGEIPTIRAGFDEFFQTIETREGEDGKVALFNERRGQDAPAEETAKVQKAIEGGTLIDAAQFVADTGSEAQQAVAEMVVKKLQALQDAGFNLDLKVAHRGFPVPMELANARGYTESAFDAKGRDITVWLNGADVTGKVGVDYETLLHELVHAATMGAVMHGRAVKGSPFAADVAALMDVTDAIAAHINQRFADADAGRATLTEFEKDLRAGANNAFTQDDETLAWALSSVEAQQYLETIPYKRTQQSLWQRFVQAVRSALGLKPQADTALSEVLRVGASILGRKESQVRGVPSFWHKRGLRMTTQQSDGSTVAINQAGAVYADSPTHNTNFASNPDKRPGTAQDKAVMRAIADGKSARDVLRLIASSSKNPFNRQVAQLLLKAGVTPDIVFGHIGKRGADGIHGQYRGKTDTIHIAGSAEYAAERIFLHEAMHAATMRALRKKGLHSIQLRKLFEHVSKQKSLAGFYGIKNVDEFVAEVFTNPDFQQALRNISAPSGSPLKTAWDSFVRIMRSILGLGNDSHSALSQALNLGVGVVREDMLIRKKGTRMGMRAEGGVDPDAKAAVALQQRVEGMSAQELAQFLASDNTPAQAAIARRVSERLTALQKQGVKFDFKVSHIGTFAPAAMNRARAYTEFEVDDKGQISVTVWAHGADMQGRVGMDKGTLLHELVHAVTGAALQAGRMHPDSAYRQSVGDLRKLHAALVEHIIDRRKRMGDGISEFEKSILEGANNAMQSEDEILAWGLTNPEMQSLLESMPYQGATGWGRFVQTIRNLLGLAPSADTGLSEVLRIADQIMSADPVETSELPNIAKSGMPMYSTQGTARRWGMAEQDGDGHVANFGTDDMARNIGDGLKSITVPNVKRLGKHKLTDWLKLGLQFLGRRQLVDIYGDMLPMAEYDRLAAQMEADKNESGSEADELVRRWAKLPDEGKLADLMHEATLAQIDADSAVAHDPSDDQMQSRALKGRFDALSPQAQKVYREARDSYRAHHAQVRQAIKDRIERSELSNSRRTELLQRMDDDFFQKVKGVYFPLARFGQYVVAVKDAGGQVVSVSRAETMPEAERARAQLLGAFPKDKGFSVGRVTLDKEFVASHKMVGRGFMTDLYRAMEGIDLPTDQLAEMEDTLGQLYLSSLPDLSWAKHGIHRKGTPGFSQDARRAFAQNTFHGARYLAKLRYGDRMQSELEAMQKHVDEWSAVEDFDQPGAQRVVDEMMKRHDTMMNPKSNPLATAMTSLGFVYYLGLSPAAAVVNLSQTGLVAYPVMAAKWGYAKTASALLKASEESVRGKNDIRTQLKSQDEIDAYDRAVASGVIDVTQAHDLAGVAQGEDQRVAWKLRPVMKAASFLFHHAERFNRQATFMAAYRLAKEAGSKNAYEDAVKATYDGHFDYSSSNRPRVMQGNVARVVLLFKQFAQNMIYTIGRQAYLSVQGESPEVRKQARKTFAGLMVTHAMGAGVLGLPLVAPLLAVASMLGGSDDEPWDAEVALRNMLADTFGAKASEVIAKGLSRLTPWDISGRVGLDNLIFPDVQEGIEGQRWAESFATGMLGPVIGMGVNAAKAAQSLGDGNYQRALEEFMPVMPRSSVKAYRYWTEGDKDKTGVVVKDEVGLAGVLGQVAGFSPSEVRLAREGRSAVLDQDRRLGARRSELLAQYAHAAMRGDADGKQDAANAIRAFNEKNPTRRITVPQMMQSMRNRQKRIDQAQDGVYLPRTRRDAAQAGAFALDGA
ncbi:MAG: PLxRFG domain-containing protein [Candidatus Paceibacterota bacterium]|jgi:hypothetical protein